MRIAILLAGSIVGLASSVRGDEPIRRLLEYAPAPIDNPLKGLVPYAGEGRSGFPHSMEFDYLPLSDLVLGPQKYDWTPLEKLLQAIAQRGHQAIFRIYMEYPHRKRGIPEYLLRDGLKVHRYRNTNAQPPAMVETPDYEDPRLRKMLTDFIAALGKKYDGDLRIGFITAGLLGTWGEWHTYPRVELFASKTVQAEVLDAYEAHFRITPILVRYPVGNSDPYFAPNAHRRFGYHDDSFAWATLTTGKKGDEWFYMTALAQAGPKAIDKWKIAPIGGEIRPEAWGKVFDDPPGDPSIQDFRACVEKTHASWLLDSGMFEKRQPAGRVQRAEREVRRMGYEFHLRSATFPPLATGTLRVEVELENRGVAPFYYDWKAEWGLLAHNGEVVKTFPASGKLIGLLPNEAARTWKDALPLADVPAGNYRLALRVPNPLPKGQPLRFANRSQDVDRPGWVTLGTVQIR